ncbi:hypothetical protein HN51_047705, partial [Arachis hypogaea]
GSPGIEDSGKSEAHLTSAAAFVTSCKHEFHFQCILECLVVPFLCFGEFILLYHFYALKKVLTGRASHEVLLRIAHALHDLVATPDLVNKADVESMGRNGYENPSLPTVPETHYVETASHRRKSSTAEFCLIFGAACLPHPSKHWWSSLDLFLVATTSSSKLGRESFIDLNLPAPAEQDDANQFEDSAISDAEFVNSVK